ELAREDVLRWCESLTLAQLEVRPSGIAPVAFHVRHIVRSADRLLTYAEGKQLSAAQLEALSSEMAPTAAADELFQEFRDGIDHALARVVAFGAADLTQSRTVGRKALPTSVGGLLVHVADHTQRHTGQAITTAKIVAAER
ncbi:MAG TPA: DinB family protein, partial [Terriglobales bacterium]